LTDREIKQTQPLG